MTNYTMAFRTIEGSEKFKQMYDANLSLWKVDYESFYVTTRFGETHILATGPKDASPLILLHGFGFGATMWYANIHELSQYYRVYAIDILADFNLSVVTKPYKEKKDCAEWLSDVFHALGIEQAAVCGHSAGGWQAINFSILYPEKVNKLVLLAPAASFIPFYKQFFVRLFSIMLIPKRSFVINSFCSWFVAKGNKVESNLFEQFYLGLKHYKFTKTIVPSVFSHEDFKKVNMPTLVMVGDKEVIYNYEKMLKKAQQLIPHIKNKVIQNAGHALSIEQANVVNDHIIKFLNSKETIEFL
ncbi:alpha/beta fold hydrolase [Lederbergia wuyishanensis]|uniref:Pimeloyl-ACP methyl ester carboxylesterase n=1 Tax=Lederbergia wuyishanensis TaxID=1347903 RepID=A0ABU0D3P7_9BACI|nr:alpha/beta hydrolase [Lederbergia wuyishanensis]MCJ8007827.1 alpha/beta hydrolase [Lederbergia wuyishanensis]MDQ0343005.1 pimeloyl-ACP methyl ester carboxylesterase [Lederbergia wuyishanensis]